MIALVAQAQAPRRVADAMVPKLLGETTAPHAPGLPDRVRALILAEFRRKPLSMRSGP